MSARPPAMRALLFDLDDTLLDYTGGTEQSWAEACTAVATPAGADAAALTAALVESRRWFWGDPERHRIERVDMLGAWTKIVEHALTGCGGGRDGLAAAIAEDYAARRRVRMALFPDALPCLLRLAATGIPLALVTNGDVRQQRDKIERFGLERFFATIVIEGEFGVGKPDPAVYHHVLGALRVRPEEVAMVGDHLEWDVGAPQRLGARGVWIDRAGAGLPPDHAVRPDRIIRSLEAFPD